MALVATRLVRSSAAVVRRGAAGAGSTLQAGSRCTAPRPEARCPRSVVSSSAPNRGTKQQQTASIRLSAAAAAVASVAVLGYELAVDGRDNHMTQAQAQTHVHAQERIYTRSEVAAHNNAKDRIWVTYMGVVYDITEFVQNHPGGVSKIMLAAGKDIGPFWRIYQQHTNSALPREILTEMRIGILDPKEPPVEIDDTDPYAADPERHPGLTFHSTKPANAELPPSLIMDNWITPNDLFFIRHHHPVPQINVKEFHLDVSGTGVKPIILSLDDLRHRFPKSEVTATLQCGGNRRSEFNKIQKTSGIDWGYGAMSTARYGGVLLRDVLMFCGLLKPESATMLGVKHVQFKSKDGLQASIPIEKALSPYGDVLLVFEMNGKPLPPEHGGPLRVIVPGHVGVRNVKWLDEVVTSHEEAEGPWQRGISYKGFAPSITSFNDVEVEKIHSIQEQPITSAIVEPQPNEEVEPDQLFTVRGFAWSGGGRGIVRVDVSIDDGKTWHTAELTKGSEQHMSRAWAWTFWEIDLPAPATAAGSNFNIICKATDASYNSQPENPEPIWNIRGLNNNSWHRVPVTIAADEEE